jgi:hypothetical protein
MEAGQKRKLEQEALLKEMMAEITQVAVTSRKPCATFLAFGMQLLGVITADRLIQKGNALGNCLNLTIGDRTIEIHCAALIQKISTATRTPEEAMELLAQLVTTTMKAGLADVHAEYEHQANSPQGQATLYGGPATREAGESFFLTNFAVG